MSWFTRSRKRDAPGRDGLAPGVHHSPALAALTEEIEGRRFGAILDLGASLNDNLVFLGRYTDNIVIRDLAGSRGEPGGPRSAPLRLEPETLGGEEEKGRYGVVLLWDLLHYVDAADQRRFARRLAALCEPGAWLLLIASATAPIPPTPLRFRIHDREHLVYEAPSDQRLPSPQWTARGVEQAMVGFHAERFFQLRNGLQEFLFTAVGAPAAEPEDEESRPPGDWY